MHDVHTNENYRRRLGRGLSALLGGAAPAADEIEIEQPLELRHVAVDAIQRNPYQPRKEFGAEALTDLAASVREHGILQPLLVREVDGGMQLVAGERRWLAAKKAGLTTVPCRVVDVIDKTACEFALEENLKRQDLTDLEKASAFRQYLDHFQCTIEELARQLSMNRSTVSNMLRLLELPEPVKNALQSGKITAGHARAILALEDTADQLALCGRIQAESLSVRQTEAAVKQRQQELAGPAVEEALAPAEPVHSGPAEHVQPLVFETAPETISMDTGAAAIEAARTNHVSSLEDQLGALLGVKVQIALDSKESGTIVIPFASNSEFERILTRLRRAAA
jgi:ParB family chromosome partitioning protein